MKSVAVVSLLASVAFASTIPTGISDRCSAHLQTLDNSRSLASCTSAVIKATASFGPGSSGSGDVNTALTDLCSTDPCPEYVIRPVLADFYKACQPELSTNLNQKVLQIYDILYTIIPLRNAACTKDDSGKFCATEIGSTAPSASSLYSNSQQVVTPNYDTLESSNAAFLFLQPTAPTSTLCAPCTRNIITSYISFETDALYAPGLGQSILLGGQPALYEAITSNCSSSFLGGVVQAAGSLSNSIIDNAAPRTLSASGTGAVASLFGAVTLVLAAIL